MQLPPPAVLASWPTPNYEHPSETRGPAILILASIFAPITLLIVLLRVYTRLRISRSFGTDDLFILLALVPTLTCGILTVVAVSKHGWDRHSWDVTQHQLVTGLKFTMAVEVSFGLATSLTKLSLLFFLRKLLSPGVSMLKRVAEVVIIVVAAEMIVLPIVVINTCRPVSAYWTLSQVPQECINESAHLLYGGTINTVTDFCVVILPIPVVMKLHLPWRQQIILVGLFGAGFVTVFAGIVRLYYTRRATTAYDKTWFAYPLWISGTIELYLGIIAASVPAIKPLISRYLPKMLGSSATFIGQSSFTELPQNGRASLVTSRVGRNSHIELAKIPPGVSSFTICPNRNSTMTLWKNAHPVKESATTSVSSFRPGDGELGEEIVECTPSPHSSRPR